MITTLWEFLCNRKAIQLIFVLNLAVTYFSISQVRSVNALSVVEQSQFSFTLQHPHFIHYSSKKYVDLLYYDRNLQSLVVAQNNGNGEFTHQRTIAAVKEPTAMTVGAINNDGIDDIVLVYRDLNSIIVLTSNQKDSTFSSKVYNAGYYPEHATIGDITNDDIPDIICYGRLSSGITLLEGKKNGTFKSGKTLFPDFPVSDFCIVNLNKDGIADVGLFNWLTNEMTFYIGTGKLQFSEQTVLSFGQDSVQVLCDDMNGDDITDVIVASTQYKTIQVYHGDGLGSYNFSQTLTLFQSSSTLASVSIQTPESKDFVSENISTGSFSLFLNRGDGSFYDEVVYGVDSAAQQILFGVLMHDGFSDAIVLNRNASQYETFWNGTSSLHTGKYFLTLAVGNQPNNLLVYDVDGDGKDDPLVSNGNSSNISILLSKGNSFNTQVTVETPQHPTAISVYAKTDSSLMLITSHQNEPRISIVTLHRNTDTSSSLSGDADIYSIPLPEKSITVMPDLSLSQNGISLYAFMPSATNSIVFYQQVKGSQFLSKSLVPVIPSKIIYSTIADFNFDGKTDLAYIYYDSQLKKNFLGITLNDSTGEYRGKVFTESLPDTSIKRAFLFIDDFNGDTQKDFILYTSPANSLRFTTGRGEKFIEKFSIIESYIHLRSPDQIQIYDFDGDGVPDIILSDSDTWTISVMRGKGNGTFYPREELFEIPRDAVFRCGDFNGDGITDIAYTHPNEHTITIQYGKKK